MSGLIFYIVACCNSS